MKDTNQQDPFIYNRVYNAALLSKTDPIKATTELQRALAAGCIDEWDSYRMSAVSVLAQAGDQKATEWLIAQGASISQAAYGAALGGDRKWATHLLSRGGSIHFVARAAAIRGDWGWTEDLISEGA